MKKSIQVLLAGCLIVSIDSFAQPTLTASGVGPVTGNQITNKGGTYSGPTGTAGANQTWDLSGLPSTSSIVSSYIVPSTTPNASSFPGATVAVSTTGSPYGYYKTSSTVWQNIGAVSPAGVIIPYSNPEDILHFPFSYNSTYSDPWATTFTNTGYTFYRTGTTTVTADGYGTLITPAGTFTNVLRVHFVEVYQDSAQVGGTPYIIDYNNDEYIWYLNNNHAPIAFVFTLTASGFPSSQSGYYTSNVQGINESNALVSFDLSPNPSSDNINITISLKEKQETEIRLFNSIGDEVNKLISAQSLPGLNNYSINVQNLPEGIYFAEVFLNGVPASTRRFSVCK